MAEAIVAVPLVIGAAGAGLLLAHAFPGATVFPLAIPAIVLAILLAGGRAGVMVIAGYQLLSWYLLVPIRNGVRVHTAGDAVNLVLTTLALLLLLWVAARYQRLKRDTATMAEARAADLQQTQALRDEQAVLDRQLADQDDRLRATRRNLEAIYQASGDGLALCEALFDADGKVGEYQVLEVNRAHAELTAATREQMLSMPVSTIYPPIDPRWFETAEKVLKTGIMHDFDIRSRATGRWLNIRVSRVSDTLFQQTFVDVSERHRLEEQRHALLKEMSHRVMNNFQMIAGFLGIQAAGADPLARDLLKTAQRRVQVLANLHSLLAYTEGDREIDAAAYIRELCGYLGSTFDRPGAIALACEAGDLTLPTDKIVPIGFVISELVTNSAKYAYPEPLSGVIRVSMQAQSAGWVLTISDDGCGITGVKPDKGGGLGTRLVQRFVHQIGAHLTTTSDGGVRHEIRYQPPGAA
ncbi:two-component sensor histidine kinase [Sphingomonas vulcanisoli]|uniref:histidine kinase n=1 Tax=Sphingomonas vulcanisoli TaxID=1658060 RepID=A0ABX0TT42_9SPHN|nr:histidine kinase dimerization/phosphoacceptor domain -containing protein [Sphingomonas vulcanisoli]NIJ07425.1 two-component sensor histidine kinase [Sphingomonas vulcanisoli]